MAGPTPTCQDLHDAAFVEDLDDLRRLLTEGGDPNCRDEGGQTVLMTAASGGGVEVVDILLKAGANPSLRDDLGKTAMDYVQEKLEIVRDVGATDEQRYSRVVALLAQMTS